MALSSAVFDFDGTIVDSMPMWHDVTVELLRAHDAGDAERIFVESEHMPTREMCHYFHERYVPDATGEELVAELLARMRREYATTVGLLPGCREFLDALRDAGVPMAIASSTPSVEVEVAVAAQGLGDYFKEVISTGNGIRSKRYPDIWEKALRDLGVSAEGAWVFEDAPFGLKSAHEAGCGTVCLFSPHGDRDEAECRGLCDILVHGYPELSVDLLAGHDRAVS